MGVKTYNPRKVLLTFDGVPITGFADGSMIEVSMTSDGFTMQTGGDGEVARTANADESGSVKITLMQTSASNDYLSAKHAADKLTNMGTGSLMVKDGSGRTVINASEAWVKKSADAGFGKENGTREWTIDCAQLNMTIGGNN